MTDDWWGRTYEGQMICLAREALSGEERIRKRAQDQAEWAAITKKVREEREAAELNDKTTG